MNTSHSNCSPSYLGIVNSVKYKHNGKIGNHGHSWLDQSRHLYYVLNCMEISIRHYWYVIKLETHEVRYVH